jgi:hypothetical protein
MRELVAGVLRGEDLIKAIERLKEDLMNLPTRYPNPTQFRSPFYEEDDDF